jgi:hypothetical protein
MFVKICGQLEGQRDDTVIECGQVRWAADVQSDAPTSGAPTPPVPIVRRLIIQPVRGGHEIEWLVSGDNMQVYLLNNEGKTIDKLW